MEKTVHRPGAPTIYDSSTRAAGFTLVEISIVLVIIGLLVGAIVVGHEMLLSARIRQQIKQVETFDTSVNAFKMKYNCLPGDCNKASQLGLGCIGPGCGWPLSSSPNGDGDGEVCTGGNTGACIPAFGAFQVNGENINFWYQLYQAGYIPPAECVSNSGAAECSGSPIGVYTPRAKLDYSSGGSYGGIGIYNLVYANQQAGTINVLWDNAYYFGSGFSDASNPILRAPDVMTIDQKIDDGFPGSGKVQSRKIHNAQNMDYTGDGCVNTAGTTPIYATSNSFNCNMMVKTGW
jgi:prepilin-type N-terminal cleavage/methylation domain-containing protein